MALYKMTEQDAQNALTIIDAAQITGSSAESVVLIKQALRNPIEECKCKEKGNDKKNNN